MYCADAMRRGLPSTVRVKSEALRSVTGRPERSTTLTSTGTTSTEDLNVGRGCCGSWVARSRVATEAIASDFIGSSERRTDPVSAQTDRCARHHQTGGPAEAKENGRAACRERAEIQVVSECGTQ